MAKANEDEYASFKKQERDRLEEALASRERFYDGQFVDKQDAFKEQERAKLNFALGNNQVFERNLVVDNDDPSVVIWPHLYDPDCDKMLFGRLGLPMDLWQGQKFYECPSRAHPDV